MLDDDVDARERICSALETRDHVTIGGMLDQRVGALARIVEPTVIIIRVSENPGATIAVLRAACNAPVIGVATEVPVEWRAEALRHGIDSLLAEPVELSELLARVEYLHVSRRSRSEIRIGDLTIDRDGHVARRAGVELSLTPREYQLLLRLASHVGVVQSKRHLLERVWNFDQYDVNVVEVHISSLRHKIEALGPRIIHTVRGAGYVLRAETVDIATAC